MIQRSTEWRELYLWLKDFHDKRVKPCLDKDLFSESAQLYLWGCSDDDGVLALEHAELIQKFIIPFNMVGMTYISILDGQKWIQAKLKSESRKLPILLREIK
jgi:hypothetical protein